MRRLQQFIKRFLPIFWIDKIFNLHLLKLSRTENKISRRNFIAKRLALLSNSKRQVWIKTINNVLKIGKNSLSGFWTKICNAVFTFSGADARLKHHIKRSRFTQRISVWAFNSFFCNHFIHLPHGHAVRVNAIVFKDMIRTITPMINRIFTQWINKRIHVPTRLPDFRIHQNRRIDAIYIITLVNKHSPP